MSKNIFFFILTLLLLSSTSCGDEDKINSKTTEPNAEDLTPEKGGASAVHNAEIPLRSVNSPPSDIGRWKYGVPPGSVGNDGERTVDACWYTVNAHSVVLARVLEDSTIDSTTCPSPYRDSWRPLSLEVLDVIAGQPVPAQLDTAGMAAGHVHVQKGELRMISLRQTELGWYAIGSVRLIDEASPEYATTATPTNVSLPDNLAEARDQMTHVFEHHGDPEVCPPPFKWTSDAEFAEWLHAPSPNCAEPFVDPLQEP